MTDIATKAASAEATVPFAKRFVASEAFRVLFRDGMALIEETAAYLDGAGRTESKALPRLVALTYATESMRLTTRLMQLASWLLIQRAVAEGEISPEQAQTDHHRVKLSAGEGQATDEAVARLPERLRELIEHSLRLHARIRHLDTLMSDEAPPMPAIVANPIASQIDLLRTAFRSR